MRLYFLGTGNAFGHGGRRRSHYWLEGNENWLIDASYDAPAGMRSIRKNVRDIDKIFISHLHPDHFMGIPQFTLENYYVIRRETPIPVYGPVGLEKILKDATELFFNEDVLDHLDQLFLFNEMPENRQINFEGGSIETLPADHSGNARMQIITQADVSIGYTGDTAFLPVEFEKLLETDLVITEASSGTNPIPNHTTAQQLIDYDIPEDKRVYLSHVGESTITMSELIKPPLYLAHDNMMVPLRWDRVIL